MRDPCAPRAFWGPFTDCNPSPLNDLRFSTARGARHQRGARAARCSYGLSCFQSLVSDLLHKMSQKEALFVKMNDIRPQFQI